jgi:luciferase family oxidoreductase group 1
MNGEHPFARVRATPEPTDGTPPVWLLGSSDYSAAVAAVLGTGFSFAHFINPAMGDAVVKQYRDTFKPSPTLAQPDANVGVGVVVADTSDEALRLASSVRLWRRRLMRGDPGPVPTIEEALHELGPAALERPRDNERRLIIGNPDEVRVELEELAESYGVDELIVLTIVHDHPARVRSYELLAEAFADQPPQ